MTSSHLRTKTLLIADGSEMNEVGRLLAKAPVPPCAVQELLCSVPAYAVASLWQLALAPRSGFPAALVKQRRT